MFSVIVLLDTMCYKNKGEYTPNLIVHSVHCGSSSTLS